MESARKQVIGSRSEDACAYIYSSLTQFITWLVIISLGTRLYFALYIDCVFVFSNSFCIFWLVQIFRPIFFSLLLTAVDSRNDSAICFSHFDFDKLTSSRRSRLATCLPTLNNLNYLDFIYQEYAPFRRLFPISPSSPCEGRDVWDVRPSKFNCSICQARCCKCSHRCKFRAMARWFLGCSCRASPKYQTST